MGGLVGFWVLQAGARVCRSAARLLPDDDRPRAAAPQTMPPVPNTDRYQVRLVLPPPRVCPQRDALSVRTTPTQLSSACRLSSARRVQ